MDKLKNIQSWLWVALLISLCANFYQYSRVVSIGENNQELRKQQKEGNAERDQALKDLKIKTDSETVARQRFDSATVKPKPVMFTPITVSRNIHSDSLSHLLTDLYK